MTSPSNTKPVSDFISQAYILHRTGLVTVARIYKEQCISGDPQLIGGFLAAILTFVGHSHNKEVEHCPGDPDGVHQLTEISTSCSKWYIATEGEYVIALLIPNGSPLNRKTNKKLILALGINLLNSFLLLKEFNINVEESLADESTPHDQDFGNTVDNMVADTLSNIKGYDITFENKGTLQMFDLTF